MKTTSFLLVSAAVISAGCVDLKTGLACSTDDDCMGLACVEGRCSGDAASEGPPGQQTPEEELSFVSYALYDGPGFASGNGDGVLNRNESVRLNVKVKNNRSSTLSKVTGTLSTTSALAFVDSGRATKSFGDIAGGREGCIGGPGYSSYCGSADRDETFRLTVPKSTPDGTVVPMSLLLTDASGKSWTVAFSIAVSPIGGSLVFASYAIFDGNYSSASGNGDRVLNRNETIRLNVSVKNAGKSALRDVMGTLSTASSLAIVDPAHATKGFNTIYGEREVCLSSYCDVADSDATFRVTVPGTTPDGSVLPMELLMKDGSGNSWSLKFSLTVAPTSGALVFVSQAIYDGTSYSCSGNGDGVLNRNETVRLNVTVKNIGISTLLGVSGTLSTPSAFAVVDAANATRSFGDIYGNRESCLGSYCSTADFDKSFRVTVPNTTPDGTVVPMSLLLTDSSGNSWNLEFSLAVSPVAASLALVSSTLYDGNYYAGSGNGDGVLNAGEKVRLNVKVKNIGNSTLLGVSGTLSSASPSVTVDPTNATKSFDTISGGRESCLASYCTADNDYGFLLTVASGAADYTDLPMSLTMRDASNNTWVLTFSLRVYPAGAVVVASTSFYDATSGSPLLTDGDGDHRWDQGETIRLNIGLRNTGAGAVTVQSVSLATTSPSATILQAASVSPGSIGGKSTVWLNGSSAANQSNLWRISLNQTTPPGTVVPFEVTIVGSTATWRDSFSITTY